MTPTVCLLPWGDPIEEYLDAIGLSLEQFRDEMSGGWLFGYVEALRCSGVGTVLVCWSRGVPERRTWRHRPTGAPLIVLPARGAWHELHQLGRVVRGTGAAAVLCQEYEYERFERCVALGRLLGVPVFATHQGALPPDGFARRLVRRIAVRAAAGLIAAPAAEAERVRNAYGRGVHRIPNPLDARDFGRGPRAEVRDELGFGDGEVVVAWHGRVERHTKGLDLLADAWRELCTRDDLPPRRLLLVGSGPYRDDLRVRLAGTAGVCWIDRYVLDKARIASLLAAADVYAFPSRHEGFAVAPLEAMATGLPMVAAAAPGVADLTGDEPALVVVPVGDSGALAAALAELIADPAARAALGARARRRIEEAYAPESVGRALRHVLLREAA